MIYNLYEYYPEIGLPEVEAPIFTTPYLVVNARYIFEVAGMYFAYGVIFGLVIYFVLNIVMSIINKIGQW